MTPYYDHAGITIYHGDCRSVLADMPDNTADVILTDPPYGIGKAEWDRDFPTWWLPEASRLAVRLGLMPGVWNILA